MDYTYILPDKTKTTYDDFITNCTDGVMNQIDICNAKEMGLEVIMQGSKYGDNEVYISIRMHEIRRCNFYYYDEIHKDIYISLCAYKTNCDLVKFPKHPKDISFNLKQGVLQIQQYFEQRS